MWGSLLNSRPAGRVFVGALFAVGLSGCVQIDGGAAELSWSIRDSEGRSVSTCSDVSIQKIRLCWQSVEEAGTETLTCPDTRAEEFECVERTGVTGFEIDPGRTALFIIPLCEPGDAGIQPAVEESYVVPPPIVRTVEDGRVVTLNSLLLVVNRTNCCEEIGQTECDQCTCRQ